MRGPPDAQTLESSPSPSDLFQVRPGTDGDPDPHRIPGPSKLCQILLALLAVGIVKPKVCETHPRNLYVWLVSRFSRWIAVLMFRDILKHRSQPSRPPLPPRLTTASSPCLLPARVATMGRDCEPKTSLNFCAVHHSSKTVSKPAGPGLLPLPRFNLKQAPPIFGHFRKF